MVKILSIKESEIMGYKRTQKYIDQFVEGCDSFTTDELFMYLKEVMPPKSVPVKKGLTDFLRRYPFKTVGSHPRVWVRIGSEEDI